MKPENQASPSRSRREFIKTTSLAVAASTLTVARSAHAGVDETIKVGLVGCGSRGAGAASQALHTAGPVKLVAMGDAFQDRLDGTLQALQKEDGLPERIDVPKERQFVGFDAYEKVLAAGIDLVILTTPPGFRPIHFAAAVNAGKHIFMEKPVAVDGPGVRAVLEAAKEAKRKGLAVGVGLQRHHQKSYLETIKRLQDGAIGDILATRVYWNSGGVWVNPRQKDQTDMEYQMRNWYYFNWLCGDHIVEQHIHNLDVSNWLKNAHPIRAQGMGGREVRKAEQYGEIFDHHAVEFEYADGTRMFSYCRHIEHCWESVSEHAIGTKGTADISDGQITVVGGDKWKFQRPDNAPYQVEHDDLFASIRSGNPLNEAEYGATSSMTAILGRLATYSGKIVEWDHAINSEKSLAPAKYAFDAAPPPSAVAIPGFTEVV